MNFSIRNCFSKCDEIPRKLRIWSHLFKKSLMKTLFFVQCIMQIKILSHDIFTWWKHGASPLTHLFRVERGFAHSCSLFKDDKKYRFRNCKKYLHLNYSNNLNSNDRFAEVQTPPWSIWLKTLGELSGEAAILANHACGTSGLMSLCFLILEDVVRKLYLFNVY